MVESPSRLHGCATRELRARNIKREIKATSLPPRLSSYDANLYDSFKACSRMNLHEFESLGVLLQRFFVRKCPVAQIAPRHISADNEVESSTRHNRDESCGLSLAIDKYTIERMEARIYGLVCTPLELLRNPHVPALLCSWMYLSASLIPIFHHSYGKGVLTTYRSLARRARLMIMVQPKLDIII